MRIFILGFVIFIAGLTAAAMASGQASALLQQNEQVCEGMDSGKIDVNDPQSVTITAPDGFLIDAYCVKAGSANQGDGPVVVTVSPPQKTVTITHPSGKEISHYSFSLVAITETTTTDTTTTTTTTSTTPTTPAPTTPAPTTPAPTTPAPTTPAPTIPTPTTPAPTTPAPTTPEVTTPSEAPEKPRKAGKPSPDVSPNPAEEPTFVPPKGGKLPFTP